MNEQALKVEDLEWTSVYWLEFWPSILHVGWGAMYMYWLKAVGSITLTFTFTFE